MALDIERLRQLLEVRKGYEELVKQLKGTHLVTADDAVMWRNKQSLGTLGGEYLPELTLKQVINYGLRALLSETEKQMADVDSTIRDLAKGN